MKNFFDKPAVQLTGAAIVFLGLPAALAWNLSKDDPATNRVPTKIQNTNPYQTPKNNTPSWLE